MLLFEIRTDRLYDLLIKVASAHLVQTAGGSHLHISVINMYDGDIKGSATQIVNQHISHCQVGSVRVIESGCSRLVDHSDTIESRNIDGIICCFALCIIKICRDCHHHICDRLFRLQVHICIRHDLFQNKTGYDLRCKLAERGLKGDDRPIRILFSHGIFHQ